MAKPFQEFTKTNSLWERTTSMISLWRQLHYVISTPTDRTRLSSPKNHVFSRWHFRRILVIGDPLKTHARVIMILVQRELNKFSIISPILGQISNPLLEGPKMFLPPDGIDANIKK